MKKSAIVQYLEREAMRYKQLAKDEALTGLHKSGDGQSITRLEARLVRDHEIRAEAFLAAAKIAAGHHV